MLATKSAMSSWQYLKKAIIVKVDGKRIHISKNIMAIVILNIPSYAGKPQPKLRKIDIHLGGTDLWGKSPKNFEPQTICDGLFEVVGIRGVNHMGMMQSGLSSGGQHIAQVKCPPRVYVLTRSRVRKLRSKCSTLFPSKSTVNLGFGHQPTSQSRGTIRPNYCLTQRRIKLERNKKSCLKEEVVEVKKNNAQDRQHIFRFLFLLEGQIREKINTYRISMDLQ